MNMTLTWFFDVQPPVCPGLSPGFGRMECGLTVLASGGAARHGDAAQRRYWLLGISEPR
jgi:hypothetical protein